jgi:F0F1-type ATP synthase membrane subunit b/b'
MSVREIVGRLTDAKAQLAQVRLLTGQLTANMTEARSLLDTVLDDAQSRALSTAIAAQGKAIQDELQGTDALTAGIDATIRRVQGIGSGR